MSNHSTAFVPIEAWCYSSPDLKMSGRTVDLGRLAEALIYYDQVIFNVATQDQFSQVLRWFTAQGKFEDFLSLVKDKTLIFYEYSFITAPIFNKEDNSYWIWSLQDEEQAKDNSFEKRFLYHESVEKLVEKSRKRERLYKAFRGNVIEVKASDFDGAVEMARADSLNPQRNAILYQAYIDELYKIKKLGKPPTVEVTASGQGTERVTTTFNIDFSHIKNISGLYMDWHNGSPLSGGAVSNIHILAASKLNVDLFLSNPMGTLVSDKLYESAQTIQLQNNLDQLKSSVEFPDVRKLVNQGRLSLDDIMMLRAKAKRFRSWLQSESDRDRDAIIAYHNEVAKDTGIGALGSSTLNLVTMLGAGAAAVYSGTTPETQFAIGAGVAGVSNYLTNLAARLNSGWKPVVFGEWMSKQIKELDRGN
jgi:hypothetical protein